MPVDLSEFEELSRCHPTQCVIARSCDAVEEAERANLRAALDAGHVTDNAISKWLQKRGLGGREDAVKKHRAGTCCCA